MGAFFVYILKSGFCLALFYLFYRLLLSKETFHRFNRIALLGVLALSLVIPFIQYKREQPEIIQAIQLPIDQLVVPHMEYLQAQPSTSIYLLAIVWLYLMGILFYIIRTLYSFYHLHKYIKGNDKIKMEDNIQLYITDENIAPFSWMNKIVISRTDWLENAEEIINHEIGHLRHYHSWDLIFTNICAIFHWFNPAIWLIKQELQNIHEYEADENVLNHGIDAKKYQLLLIKKAVGSQRFTSMANSFNHSKLKKRITMMLKSKSNPWARVKYLYILPLSAIVVASFARPEISNELDKISEIKFSEINSPEKVIKRDTIVIEYRTDTTFTASVDSFFILDGKMQDERIAEIDPNTIQSINILKGDKGIKVTGTINKKDVSIAEVDEEKDLVVTVGVGLQKKITQIRDSVGNIRIRTGSQNVMLNTDVSNASLLFVDDEEVENLNDIAPESIESISILKDAAAIKIYGEKGKNGVILITLKK